MMDDEKKGDHLPVRIIPIPVQPETSSSPLPASNTVKVMKSFTSTLSFAYKLFVIFRIQNFELHSCSSAINTGDMFSLQVLLWVSWSMANQCPFCLEVSLGHLDASAMSHNNRDCINILSSHLRSKRAAD